MYLLRAKMKNKLRKLYLGWRRQLERGRKHSIYNKSTGVCNFQGPDSVINYTAIPKKRSADTTTNIIFSLINTFWPYFLEFPQNTRISIFVSNSGFNPQFLPGSGDSPLGGHSHWKVSAGRVNHILHFSNHTLLTDPTCARI